jgi:hypothetical protein
MVLMMMLPLLALSPLKVDYIAIHLQNIHPMIDLVFASPLMGEDNYSINGPIGFNAGGVAGENSTDAIYPAFNFSLTEVDQHENKDLTANSSFLPVPDLVFETGIQSKQASTANDVSEITQTAIEKMVNPSSLISSALDDIRESGNIDSDNSRNVQPVSKKTISFINTEFSTIPLYGMNISPKDYLIVSSDGAGDGKKDKLYATARIPCNDKHETPLRVVFLENWSSISYPPSKMHPIDGYTGGQLCMFRIEQPENGINDSYITPPNTADKSTSHNLAASTAIALYNPGASAIRLPIASSIIVSQLDSS